MTTAPERSLKCLPMDTRGEPLAIESEGEDDELVTTQRPRR